MNKPVISHLSRFRIPFLAWPSLLSLDAVLVAVTWQQLLMRSFCDRSSTWPEALSLAATVWLIYVADRLLDASRLDLTRPHTLRHRFYRRHRRIFLPLWVLVLITDTLFVVRYLPLPLLQAGLVLAATVLVYGASVHFTPSGPAAEPKREQFDSKRFLVPKEIRVGSLFALGVTLTSWIQLSLASNGDAFQVGGNHRPLLTLAATTALLAILFSSNCMLVARFERELDRAQLFTLTESSEEWIKRWKMGWVRRTVAIVSLTILPSISLLLRLPILILVALVASAVGLGVSLAMPSQAWSAPTLSRHATFDIRGAWVDVVLWTPPVVLMCFT